LLRCSVCGGRDKTFLRCATCGEELYCDEKCRIRDEKIHKFSCGKWYTTVGLHGAETKRIEIKKTSKNKHAIKKNSEIKNDIEDENESGSGSGKIDENDAEEERKGEMIGLALVMVLISFLVMLIVRLLF